MKKNRQEVIQLILTHHPSQWSLFLPNTFRQLYIYKENGFIEIIITRETHLKGESHILTPVILQISL